MDEYSYNNVSNDDKDDSDQDRVTQGIVMIIIT